MNSVAHREELAKRAIDEVRPNMSKGELALYALDVYSSVGIKLPPPEWAIWQIVSCYRDFKEGKPAAYRPGAIKAVPAPNTLGEAFGVPDHRGGAKVALKRRRAALALPRLIAMFNGERDVRLPRTKEGYAEAANRTGLTPDQVEDLLPRTRANVRKKRIAE